MSGSRRDSDYRIGGPRPPTPGSSIPGDHPARARVRGRPLTGVPRHAFPTSSSYPHLSSMATHPIVEYTSPSSWALVRG